MRLHSVHQPGPGPSLVVLHGLYGSSRSWSSPARVLSSSFDVTLLDLRNHGRSGHDDDCSWSAMAADVRETLDGLGLERPLLLGHSLGGKVAMRFAADWPESIRGLVIADIAPRRYQPDAQPLEAMLALDLEAVERRSDADRMLAAAIPDATLRGFLLTNLVREGEGYRWQANLSALHRSLDELGSPPLGFGETYAGETLFVVGAFSGYWRGDDLEQARAFFPRAVAVSVPGSGHNVHVENTEAFCDAVRDFASRLRA